MSCYTTDARDGRERELSPAVKEQGQMLRAQCEDLAGKLLAAILEGSLGFVLQAMTGFHAKGSPIGQCMTLKL